MEMLGVVGKNCPQSNGHPILGRPWPVLCRKMVFSVGWGPPASVLPCRGPSSSPTCPRRLAWPQRAPCPSLAGFCSRPPTWAPGQALRQGPVPGNNTTVFLMVEGRPKDEEGETCTEKGRMELGEGALSQGYTRSCGVSQRSLVGGWGKVPGSLERGGAQNQGSPSLESESLVHSSKRGLGEIKGGTS